MEAELAGAESDFRAGRYAAAARRFASLDAGSIDRTATDAPVVAIEAALSVNRLLCSLHCVAADVMIGESLDGAASAGRTSDGGGAGVAVAADIVDDLEAVCERLSIFLRGVARRAVPHSPSTRAAVAVYLSAGANAAIARLHTNGVAAACALCDRVCDVVALVAAKIPPHAVPRGVAVAIEEGTAAADVHPLVAYAQRQRLEAVDAVVWWCAPSAAATAAATRFALIVAAVAVRSSRAAEATALLRSIDRRLSAVAVARVARSAGGERAAKRPRGETDAAARAAAHATYRLRLATRVALATAYACGGHDATARSTLRQHLGLPSFEQRAAEVGSAAPLTLAALSPGEEAGTGRVGAVQPDWSGAFLLAWLEGQRGAAAEACAIFESIARGDPEESRRSSALNSAGCVEMVAGRTAAAIAQWRRAAQLHYPTVHAHALFNTARAHRLLCLAARRASSVSAEGRDTALSGELLALLEHEMRKVRDAPRVAPTPRLLSLQHAVASRARAAELRAAPRRRALTVAAVPSIAVTFEAALAALAGERWGDADPLLMRVYCALHFTADAAGAVTSAVALQAARSARRELRQAGASVKRVHRLYALTLLQQSKWEVCIDVCRCPFEQHVRSGATKVSAVVPITHSPAAAAPPSAAAEQHAATFACDVPLLVYAADAFISLERPRRALALLARALLEVDRTVHTSPRRVRAQRSARQLIMSNMALAKLCIGEEGIAVELLHDAQAQALTRSTAAEWGGARGAAEPWRAPLAAAQDLAVAFNLVLSLRSTGQFVCASSAWLEARGIDADRPAPYYGALREAAERELADVKHLRDAARRERGNGAAAQVSGDARGLLDSVGCHVTAARGASRGVLHNAVPDAQVLQLDALVLQQWELHVGDGANREAVVRLQRYLSGVMRKEM
jgi:hypothetical protein